MSSSLLAIGYVAYGNSSFIALSIHHCQPFATYHLATLLALQTTERTGQTDDILYKA